MKHTGLIILLFVFLSCHDGKRNNNNNSQTINSTNDTVPGTGTDKIITPAEAATFWDSIALQLHLTNDQMKKYTLIGYSYSSMDSFYITRYDSIEFNFKESLGFWGDSVYNTHPFKIAILRHSGANCLEKYLLVFDSAGIHNLSYTMIEEGCDRDGEDSPYSSQDYKMLSDSIFETIETYDPGDDDKTDRNITTQITKWKINTKGIVDSVPGKIVKKEPKDRPED